MTQGYPLAMVTHVIGVVLLTKQPKAIFTDVNQPWYAKNTGALGAFANVKLYFDLLKKIVPGHENYP